CRAGPGAVRGRSRRGTPEIPGTQAGATERQNAEGNTNPDCPRHHVPVLWILAPLGAEPYRRDTSWESLFDPHQCDCTPPRYWCNDAPGFPGGARPGAAGAG